MKLDEICLSVDVCWSGVVASFHSLTHNNTSLPRRGRVSVSVNEIRRPQMPSVIRVFIISSIAAAVCKMQMTVCFARRPVQLIELALLLCQLVRTEVRYPSAVINHCRCDRGLKMCVHYNAAYGLPSDYRIETFCAITMGFLGHFSEVFNFMAHNFHLVMFKKCDRPLHFECGVSV